MSTMFFLQAKQPCLFHNMCPSSVSRLTIPASSTSCETRRPTVTSANLNLEPIQNS